MKQYQIIILYQPINGNVREFYRYLPQEMTEQQAYDKCIEIEEKQPVLPNGEQFDYFYMGATYKEINK